MKSWTLGLETSDETRYCPTAFRAVLVGCGEYTDGCKTQIGAQIGPLYEWALHNHGECLSALAMTVYCEQHALQTFKMSTE